MHRLGSPALSGHACPLPTRWVEVEHNVLSHAAHGGDAAVLERRGDFRRRRFQRLWFLAEPDRFDDVAGDALVQSAGNGFNFREFGHDRSVYLEGSGALAKRQSVHRRARGGTETFISRLWSGYSACPAVRELACGTRTRINLSEARRSGRRG